MFSSDEDEDDINDLWAIKHKPVVEEVKMEERKVDLRVQKKIKKNLMKL